MDPEERQRQREARRRAREERGEDDEAPQYGGDQDDSERQREEELKRERDEQRRREVEEERKRKQEEARQREQKEKEENEKQAKKKKPKRKGLGGLSPEKKRMLKQLIMQKAAEEMKAELKKRQEEKENYLSKVVPKLEVDTDSKEQMIQIVKKYYEKLCALEGEKYDWEVKLRNIEYEINELGLKMNNVKGKFVKPVLKKVSKNEGKWAKAETSKSHMSFRDQLKSTGQNKFALQEKEEGHKNPDWAEQLKSKDSENAEDGNKEATAEA